MDRAKRAWIVVASILITTGCHHRPRPQPAAPPPPAPQAQARPVAAPAAPPAAAAPQQPIIPANPNGSPPTVLVLPLHADPKLAESAHALDELILTALAHTPNCSVIGPEDIQAMVSMEKLQDAAGCDDTACAAEIGGALGTSYLIAGKLTPLGDEAVLSLRLIDTKAGKIMSRSSARGKTNADALASIMGSAVNDLLHLRLADSAPQAHDRTVAATAANDPFAAQRAQSLARQMEDIDQRLQTGMISSEQALEMRAHACMENLAFSQAIGYFAQLMNHAAHSDERWFAFAGEQVAAMEQLGQRTQAIQLLQEAKQRNPRLFRSRNLQPVLTRLSKP